jgi:serine/threonine protein kinase
MRDAEVIDEQLGGKLRELAPAAADSALVEDLVAARLFGGATQPAKIDRFTVLELVGSGGMGTVYAAHDPKFDRKVAIKVVRSVPDSGETLALAQARLVREARVLAQLTHPHVVSIHEWGVHDERVFVVMEFIAGVSLDQWLRSSARPWTEVLELFTRIGEGLASAHALGIVHRDFKATNVIVGTDGRPRVVDFGLARPIGPRAPIDRSIASGRTTFDYSITGTGKVSGTPGYLAPELLRGAKASAQSDIYAFCVTLLEAADARSNDTMPGEVIDVLLRGLAPDPSKRWLDMNQLLEALRVAASRAHRRTKAPRKMQLYVGLIATFVFVVVALVLWTAG